MSNTNCLDGMQCPKCGSEGPFWIDATARFLVSDDGTEEYQDVAWQSRNGCECAACQHRGVAVDFTAKKESAREPYSVLLLYPETGDNPETYYAHAEAENPTEAISLAAWEAEEANDFLIKAGDFLPLIVLPGHIEAELFYRDIVSW